MQKLVKKNQIVEQKVRRKVELEWELVGEIVADKAREIAKKPENKKLRTYPVSALVLVLLKLLRHLCHNPAYCRYHR
ncbi:UNVERIFIED_CONTAM: hypothetical protein ACS92_02690 [Bacillus cereus]